jgi:hypothetical protein
MKPFLALILPLVLLLSGCGRASTPDAKETSRPAAKETSTFPAKETLPTPQTVQAIADIEKLGGRVWLNKSGEVFSVSFNDTQVTDAGLKHLKGLPSLKTLGLRDTQVTGAGLSKFKAALPKCYVSR